MTRRCSHCSNNGHNSRTCPSRGGGGGGGGAASSGILGSGYCASGGGGGGGVKLFGVRLTDGPIMKKSASMGNLLHYHSSSSTAASPNPSSPSADPIRDSVLPTDGYLSDDPSHTASSSNHRGERKKGNYKGIPWTEEEHRMFLIGLKKLGKGDWRGISRNYVVSRTPTQVASHAQKYFIRQTNSSRRKRRSSLFDMDSEPGVMREDEIPHVPDYVTEEDGEPVSREEVENMAISPVRFPAVVPAFFSVPLTMWIPGDGRVVSHEVLKPIPLLPKQPVNVDQLVGLSELSLMETNSGKVESTNPHPFSLMGSTSRSSAFHVNTAAHMPR